MIGLAYLIGSIPFGLIFVRWLSKQDLRAIGSGNIGATNVRRASGNILALVVLLCDVFKGALPVLATSWILGDADWGIAATALAAVVGHMFPAYLRLRPSGKGVATAAGAFGVIAPMAVLAALVVFLIVAAASRRVSLGSLLGAITMASALWVTTRAPSFSAAGTLAVVLIIIRHKDNIVRLAQGREPRIGDKP